MLVFVTTATAVCSMTYRSIALAYDDILIGLYHFGALGENTSYFADILAKMPLNSRDRFRPGPGVTASVGVRTQTASGIEPQLQINLRTERRESGVYADVDNSGATLVNLSPGVTMPLSEQTLAYAFAPLPVCQARQRIANRASIYHFQWLALEFVSARDGRFVMQRRARNMRKKSMSRLRVACFSISIDGFGAGPKMQCIWFSRM